MNVKNLIYASKKDIGYYIYKSITLLFDDFVRKERALVGHLFDCHKWRDKEWC